MVSFLNKQEDIMSKFYFNFNFDEQNEDRDSVQELTIRFEHGSEDFDKVLKIRLNTFLNAIGSKLEVN